MTIKPIELLTKNVPDIVNAAVAEIREQGDKGDAEAKQRYAELSGAPGGALRFVLEGKGGADVYLTSENAQLRADQTAPGVPVLMAIALPAEAVEIALEELESGVEEGLARWRRRLVRTSPKRTRALFDRLAQEQLRFHLVIKDTPDFDEVRVKVTTGSAEVADKPGFTVTLSYDTFEQLRARKLKPQAALAKLQFSGDSARAMQLAMELMQRRGS